jgi:hypothetical protein
MQLIWLDIGLFLIFICFVVGMSLYKSRKGKKSSEWLEKAYKERGRLLFRMKEDPVFNSQVTDSRFQDLLHRMKLSENEVQK